MTRLSASANVRRAGRPSALGNTPPRVGCWQLGQLIGQGRFSSVYRAAPAGSGEGDFRYAIKLPAGDCEEAPLRMLARDALVGRAVSSPHVVPVVDSGLEQAPQFVAMPLLEGHTLGALLKVSGPLAVIDALWIGRQVAQGLRAIHAAGWRHADVKPENIVVGPEGHATLIDLGSGQRIEQSLDPSECELVGTPDYLAPEAFTSTVCCDGRSDLYSLGVVLYEAITGKLPFAGCSPFEISAAHRAEVPKRLRLARPEVPTEIATLVGKLLAKQPLRRAQTADELVTQLVRLEVACLPHRLPA